MKVATILPTRFLHCIEYEDYYMCLAHLIGEDEEYTDFYIRKAKEGKYVIMDNGVIEGNPRPIEEIVKKAVMIGANEIVLPDVFMNMEETLNKTAEAIDYVRDNFHFKLMGVPQGATFEEWCVCADQMTSLDIDVIGIPKVVTKLAQSLHGRMGALQVLNNRCRGLEIHLLGCWNTPLEITLMEVAMNDGLIKKIRGVDSAIPYVFTKAGITVEDDDRPDVKFSFDETEIDMALLEKNIKLWKKACNPPTIKWDEKFML